MLCSDGVWGSVEDAEIRTVLTEALDCPTAARALIDRALAGRRPGQRHHRRRAVPSRCRPADGRVDMHDDADLPDLQRREPADRDLVRHLRRAAEQRPSQRVQRRLAARAPSSRAASTRWAGCSGRAASGSPTWAATSGRGGPSRSRSSSRTARRARAPTSSRSAGCRPPSTPAPAIRFRDEARILARFDHPGIVDVYGTFEENNTAYMVMELLRGQVAGAACRGAAARCPSATPSTTSAGSARR